MNSFIGSNPLENLLKLGQRVVGLDNFAAGFLNMPVVVGERTALNELYTQLHTNLPRHPYLRGAKPECRAFGAGDVRLSLSLADIVKARRLVGYQPSHTIAQGLPQAMPWNEQYAQKTLAVARITFVPHSTKLYQYRYRNDKLDNSRNRHN